MKSCSACNDSTVKVNLLKKKKIDSFLESYLPKDDKIFCNKKSNKIILNNVEKNRSIFYFATQSRDFTKEIINQKEAYGKFKNSGVTKTDNKGNAVLYLDCPQLYISESGKVKPRHYHFIYWDNKEKSWERDFYTQQILCDIDLNFVKKNRQKIVLMDAKDYESYMKNHIEGAISIPYNEKWTSKSIFKEINQVNNKLIPIVIYCNPGCDIYKILYEKLIKLGFYNVFHLSDK